ncbi:MAG: hypothetical protein ACYDGY_11075, partial [Acidimicrobiales bacterium]
PRIVLDLSYSMGALTEACVVVQPPNLETGFNGFYLSWRCSKRDRTYESGSIPFPLSGTVRGYLVASH